MATANREPPESCLARAFAVLVMVGALVACGARGTDGPSGPISPIILVPMMQVFTDAQTSEQIGLFARAVLRAEPVPSLQSTRSEDYVTIYMPSNVAMRAYFAAQKLTESGFFAQPQAVLTQFVRRHIVTRSEALRRQQTSLAGTTIFVRFDQPECEQPQPKVVCTVLVGDARLSTAAITNFPRSNAPNGVPYDWGFADSGLIDRVLP